MEGMFARAKAAAVAGAAAGAAVGEAAARAAVHHGKAAGKVAMEHSKAAAETVRHVLDTDPEPAGEHAQGERVPFKTGDECSECSVKFTLTTRRHNCRRCGGVFCDKHSSKKEFVAAYGYTDAVRVCDACHKLIQEELLRKRQEFLKEQINNFLAGNSSTFESTEVDSNFSKAKRGCGYALKAVTVLPIGGTVGNCIQAIDFVAKYGILGVASVALREQLMEAVDTLRLLCGEVPSLSVQDVSGGLYYLIAHKRGERGNNPMQEEIDHRGCAQIPGALLSQFVYYGPHALHHAYSHENLDIQRMVRYHGYDLIFANVDSSPEKPAFYICASREKKEAILTVRGTKNVQDCLTDIRAVPLPFPDENSTSHGHSGMSRASHWLLREVGSALEMLHKQGFRIVVTGHSLGAACAVLTSILLKEKLKIDVTCYAFATPACLDKKAAALCAPYVHSVVLHDDIVPRSTPRAAKVLAEELIQYRTVWRKQFDEDYAAVKGRVKTVWAPKTRGASQVSLPTDGATNPEEEKLEAALSQVDLVAGPEVKFDADVASEPKEPLVDLFVPGTIAHIYSHDGRYAASQVSADFKPLNEVALFANMIDDHRGISYWNALRELKFVHERKPAPPKPFQPFSSRKTCAACEFSFTWSSTSSSQAQQNLDRYVCRSCGNVICKDCASNKISLPDYGILREVRVCDPCFFSGKM